MNWNLLLVISLAMVATFCLSGCQKPVANPVGVIQTHVFVDEFAEGGLDANRWLVAYRQWGGADANGGVVPENVRVADGKLVLAAHGDHYAGPVKGINRDHSLRADGKRVGGAIATRAYFASGRYEVRMKIVPKFGAVSALWTLHYAEYYPGDPEYIARSTGAPDYYAVNHEIDIELPGRPGRAHTGIDFNYALLNTWVGLNAWLNPNNTESRFKEEATSNYIDLGAAQNDGQFHTYRIDWHTGSVTETRRVEFYVDNILYNTTYTYVPTHAGRLWIGVWFPKGWAGTPDFDTEYLAVDWVRITPFGEEGDAWYPESFPDDGWSPVEKRPDRTKTNELQAQAALTIVSPLPGEVVSRMTTVQGIASYAAGRYVEVSILPNHDRWYLQDERVSVSKTGAWKLIGYFGAEQTPAGFRFKIKAELKEADGALVGTTVLDYVQRGEPAQESDTNKD